ncbi:MAG: hypothetical protein ABWK04_07770 [Hydrogenobacter sp.]|uniref:hypothetical protein n=1 Tax=Hydrogenobacter thermophilus TaxID=940 RepID=UPI0030F6C102
MNDVKLKASDYALHVGVSLNTVKNRIRSGILKGSKEEDGIWYVYLSRDEYEHLLKSEERRNEKQKEISNSLEKLKASFEGQLIATYIEIQMFKDLQKEELLHEMSSLYTLLAVREKEIQIMKDEMERMEKALKEKEDSLKDLQRRTMELERSLKHMESQLREKDLMLAEKDIQTQKLLLEKEREILNKTAQIEKLKKELELRERKD